VELPEQPGPLGRLLAGRIYGEASAEWQPPRALEPLLWMMRESMARHGAFGEAYCPLVPVM